jgi:hypothetical protein
MDGNPDDASGWKTKLKQAVAVNKQLVPLKLTMLLYYGGNQFPLQMIFHFQHLTPFDSFIKFQLCRCIYRT